MTIRTFIVSGDDEGPHQSDGTEAYLSLPHNSVPRDVCEFGESDIWLKNPKVVAYTPVEILENTPYVRVTDPTWATRGLWQTLSALIRIKDVKELIEQHSPTTLDEIRQILALTYEVSCYEPPTIQEEAS